jgi:hypothetical protein
MPMKRFDTDLLAREIAAGGSRRTVIQRLLGLSAGGFLALTSPGLAHANHKDDHCSANGKKCHLHKECCGLCGSEGICLSCDGVAAWADMATLVVDELRLLSGSVTSAIDVMVRAEDYDEEALRSISAAQGAIGKLRLDLLSAPVPIAATNPLRALLESVAAMVDALSKYLEQIADEAYIETGQEFGEQLRSDLSYVVTQSSTIEAEISALQDHCVD